MRAKWEYFKVSISRFHRCPERGGTPFPPCEWHVLFQEWTICFPWICMKSSGRGHGRIYTFCLPFSLEGSLFVWSPFFSRQKISAQGGSEEKGHKLSGFEHFIRHLTAFCDVLLVQSHANSSHTTPTPHSHPPIHQPPQHFHGKLKASRKTNETQTRESDVRPIDFRFYTHIG